MGLEETVTELHNNKDKTHQAWTICMHSYSDLSCVSPVVFLYLLKECYAYGTCTATAKFHALQQRVQQVLHNTPQPGPAIFIAHCLYVLPLFGSYSEGFSHLVISGLRRFLKSGSSQEDLLEARNVAAQLFLDIVAGFVNHDERIVIKVLEVFDVKLTNIEKVIGNSAMKNDSVLDAAKKFVEGYIHQLMDSRSYMTAVALIQQFSIQTAGQPFLLKMLQTRQFKAAEKYATHKGMDMLCLLVQEYVNMNMLKDAYDVIKKNNLRQEFPDIYHKCKESSLKKLAEKGCWDIAEVKTNSDRQLIEYLVYLAMEAGYTEKVDELCDRYSLEGFVKAKEAEISPLSCRYLNINELVVEGIIWVDEVNGLHNASCYIEGCKVLGIDCEWKPNYEKGSKPNKVSILQVASEKRAFIFDLIKLATDVPDVLDNCLISILHSSRILKLGYNFQCDVNQLTQSYGELKCFKHFEMLLDIQNMFKEPRGGLSGLAKKVLGAGLNKTRRNSNWEQRPLSQHQLEYAALDAAVLVHIFSKGSPATTFPEGQAKNEWKSYIVAHMDNTTKPKKVYKGKKKKKKATAPEADDLSKSQLKI
ncbi:hypothetical protein VitviT2T_020864 [Vitis vinifera]|uniref:3'-5' exonuclease domain-containing protein n=2 Tax=Vitis vinifera TaxID=29760 RepID=A0ABY9D5R1_VITVI|eukprot:XP_002278277.1 PREDICTED: uncharacterized protein LOC100254615 isoform X1 [Vitis vinifera]